MKRFVLALVLAGGVSGAAMAADSPFAGSWKLNLAQSHFTGDTFDYSKTATGLRYDDGAEAYDFAIDGKDYPTLPDRTIAWTVTGPKSWDTTSKVGGKVVGGTHKMISADGSTLTSAWTEYRPDGTTGHGSIVYTRVSGSSGLAGKWKDVKVQTTEDMMKIMVPMPGHYEMSDPIYKSVASGMTDGTPSPVKGPTVPPGAMVSYKAMGNDTWDYVYTISGKPLTQGVLAVSPDGRTLTDTSWTPGKEMEKSVAVYDKG